MVKLKELIVKNFFMWCYSEAMLPTLLNQIYHVLNITEAIKRVMLSLVIRTRRL